MPLQLIRSPLSRPPGIPEVRRHIEELRRRFGGKRVMLGVDRLDMIKGIPQKLLAVEKFLEEHPEWSERVVLLQIAVPTRTEVPEYQRLRSTVHEVVGRINGEESKGIIPPGPVKQNPWTGAGLCMQNLRNAVNTLHCFFCQVGFSSLPVP